jgi:hypothetical protein
MQLTYYSYINTSNEQHNQLETTTPDSGTITFGFYLEIDNMKELSLENDLYVNCNSC